jgi:hypothetical protein
MLERGFVGAARARTRRSRLVQPLDRNRLPAQVAAVHCAKPPPPQDAARCEAARGGRQLRVRRRGAHAPRQRLRDGQHVQGARVLLRAWLWSSQ